MTEDQQLLNADVQEEFMKIQMDRKRVKSWLHYIRYRMKQTCIPVAAPEITAEEIFSILCYKIFYGHILWDRVVYRSFATFMFGKLQNIIRGIALKEERRAKKKGRNKDRLLKENKSTKYGEMDFRNEDSSLIEEENWESGKDALSNLDDGECGELALVDVDGGSGLDEERDLTVQAKKSKWRTEPSISLNINLIGKKLADESDPYCSYEEWFKAQFNKTDFGNVVEEILADPADTELLALFVSRYVEEKKRGEILREYGWTVKEYSALYNRLIYKLRVALPARFREMVEG